MNATAAATARTEVRAQIRELLKVVRLTKQQIPAAGPTVPSGMVGVLASIAALSAEPGRTADGCHVKDLAARNGLDPSTVSRAVTALVRLGLVQRAADPTDRRASFLVPTDAGRATLGEANRRYDAQLAELLHDWDSEELAAFAALLRRFNDAALHRLADPTPPTTTLEAAR